MNDIVGFKLTDLLKEINFGIDVFCFFKNKDLKRIKEIVSNPNVISYLYFNDFYLSYPMDDPNVIVKKLEIVEKLCEARHSSIKNKQVESVIFFDMIKSKKSSDDEITLDGFSTLGAWIDEKFLIDLMDDIFLADQKMTYRDLLSDDFFIAGLIRKYVQCQLFEKKLEKKFHLYELNIILNQLKKSIKDNVLLTLQGRELSVFADKNTIENYFGKRESKLVDRIYNDESIYNYINFEDLDKLAYLLPDYFYYLMLKEDKIDISTDKTINYIFRIIEKNLDLLNEYTPCQLNELKQYA